MKARNISVFLLLLALVLCTSSLNAQAAASKKVVLKPNEFTGPTHIPPEDFPKGNIVNTVGGWGGMAVAINEAPAGTDFTPFLKGLKDDLCQVPHWGYLEKGRIRILNKAQETEVVLAGSVFYMPPGHTVLVDEDARIIDFSPEKDFMELYEHIMARAAEMQQ